MLINYFGKDFPKSNYNAITDRYYPGDWLNT